MSTQGVQVPTLVVLMDDRLCPGSAGRGNSTSPSSYLLTVHDDDDDVTPLLSIQNASPGGSSNGEDCDGVDRGVIHARLYDDTQSDDDDDESVNVFKVIFDRVGVSLGVGLFVGPPALTSLDS